MKRKKCMIAAFALALLAFFLGGCPSSVESDDDDDGGDDETLEITLSELGRTYIAGYSSSVVRAYYWDEGTLKTIADADEGVSTKACSVVPTNLGDYVAGTRMDLVGSEYVERAVLWFNGAGEYLDDSPSCAFSAILHDGRILVAGWREPADDAVRPCWWEISDTWAIVDGGYAVASRTVERHDLPSESGGQARDIAASGSDVYACGYYNDGDADHACVWKNGERAALAGGERAEALCLADGTLYVGGSSAASARYWADGVGHDLVGLPAGSLDRRVSAVAYGSPGLVLAGSYYLSDNDYGFKLVSGTLTTGFPYVIGAGVNGDDVYIGCGDGWFKNDAYTELPWIGALSPQGIRMRVY